MIKLKKLVKSKSRYFVSENDFQRCFFKSLELWKRWRSGWIDFKTNFVRIWTQNSLCYGYYHDILYLSGSVVIAHSWYVRKIIFRFFYIKWYQLWNFLGLGILCNTVQGRIQRYDGAIRNKKRIIPKSARKKIQNRNK